MVNQLIIVEGIPGVGKTTTAKRIKEYLDCHGIQSKLFLEGDYEHPADYESVAFLSEKEYNQLIKKYKIKEELFNKYISKFKNDYFVKYGALKNEVSYKGINRIINVLSAYDIYNLPLEKYRTLIQSKWESFASTAKKDDSIYIFECCFLQNPLTTMMACHNMNKEYIKAHVQTIEEIITPLNPLIIFLDTEDIKANFDSIKEERSKEWLNFVIDYVTRQAYGKDKSLNGYVGLLAFYTHLKAVGIDCFRSLNSEKIILDSVKKHWTSNNYLLKSLMKEKFGNK